MADPYPIIGRVSRHGVRNMDAPPPLHGVLVTTGPAASSDYYEGVIMVRDTPENRERLELPERATPGRTRRDLSPPTRPADGRTAPGQG